MPPKKKQQKKPTKKPAKKTKSQNQGNFSIGISGPRLYLVPEVVRKSLTKRQTVDYRKASRAKGS